MQKKQQISELSEKVDGRFGVLVTFDLKIIDISVRDRTDHIKKSGECKCARENQNHFGESHFGFFNKTTILNVQIDFEIHSSPKFNEHNQVDRYKNQCRKY